MERRNKKKKQRSERGKHGEKEKKRKRDVEEDRWEKYLVSQEKFIPEIVAKHGRNFFKRKSRNMTKPADEYPQPFPHVLSRHV